MNSFYAILIALLVPVVALLWWFARRADQHKRLAIRTVTDALKAKDLPAAKRQQLQQQLAEAITQSGHSDTRAWWVPALVIALGGLFLYQKIGTPEATSAFVNPASTATSQTTTSDPSSAPPDMQTAVAALQKRIKNDPQNLDNWLLYGRSMMALKKYDEAVNAYEKARQLQPDNSWVLASLAEAKAFAAGHGNFRGEPEKLLQQALELDPDNQKALWLMGMNAFEKNQPEQAEKLWTHLLTLVDNPRVAEQLSAQIDRVRQQQGKPPLQNAASGQESNEAATTEAAAIPVRIDISPAMKAHLGDKPAVLYVYAKPTAGMPMPIAVVRGNASGFPVTVTLTDQNSLQPNRRLSGFDQVKVGARISFSGNAMPQPGDIEATETIVQTRGLKQPVELVLNKTR